CGGIKGVQDLRAESNDGKVAPLSCGSRLPDFDDVIRFRQLFAQARQAIEFLVLEIDDRIGIADRGLNQTLRIVSGRRLDYLQPGSVQEKRFSVDRVERPCVNAAPAWTTKHSRNP